MSADEDAAPQGGRISATREGHVERLTISNPGRKNALTQVMYRDLADALLAAARTPEVAVVVIEGRGGVFTSGNDVSDFSAGPSDGPTGVAMFLDAIIAYPKPIIAKVEGLAIGIGTTMLLHCDLVYAAEDARFQLPFVNLGLVPEAASSYLLPRLMGQARAAELLMFGEMFSAQTALELGVVTSVHPADDLARHVCARAAALATKAPNALERTKALLRSLPEGGVRGRMAEEAAAFATCLAGSEFKEAITAFREKRAPVFASV
ncbi:enoyl-CoA hydratase-related protein [Phenylobacterium sp.]|uniref:enoyl-CoA hydratase-related protein n=1 Tax=Phenylobacterium sp. TaxID=1871053 RepID=UPI0035B1BA2F